VDPRNRVHAWLLPEAVWSACGALLRTVCRHVGPHPSALWAHIRRGSRPSPEHQRGRSPGRRGDESETLYAIVLSASTH